MRRYTGAITPGPLDAESINDQLLRLMEQRHPLWREAAGAAASSQFALASKERKAGETPAPLAVCPTGVRA